MATKIRINSKYEYLRDFIMHIIDVFEAEGTYIYGGERNLIKSFVAPDGTALVVKRFHQPQWINKYVYSWGIRKPKGLRAFTYPDTLLAKGIETPEPVAYIEERHASLLGLSYFVSIKCPFTHTMYEMGNATEAEYKDLAMALAQYTAQMHDSDVMHRDYSPGNILWEKIDNEFHFSIVDINRMYFGHVDIRRGCYNFRRIWGPKAFFVMMVREYARCRGFNPDEAEAISIKSRAMFWTRFSKKHEVKFKLEL